MRKPISIANELGEQRADYNAGKRSSRLRRRRRGVPAMGSGADLHYASEADYLWMNESARDLDRNDVVVGQTVDRAVDNTLQGGLAPEPDTGDKKVDADLKSRWKEESVDPRKCCTQGQHTFHEQTRLMLRDALVAGDIFGLPTRDGTVQMMEFHRCRSPRRTKKNIVHGVEMTPQRKRLRYWFTKEPIDPLRHQAIKVGDLKHIAAQTPEGEANVWQMYFPKRVTQTRGVTAFAPIFDLISMHDDVQFAELLHRQVASCFFFFRNRSNEFDPAKYDAEQPIGEKIPQAGTTRRIEGVVPGMELTGAPGEMLSMASPQIPNSTFFPHVRMILTFVGVNLGVPLVMMLMDASETNFSGYRGAIDQARIGFRRNQEVLCFRWCRPYYRFKVSQWVAQDSTLRALHKSGKIDAYRHSWKLPAWPYIEPTKDATADLIRESNLLISPRRRAQERGYDFDTLVVETIEDRGSAIEKALEKAAELNKTFSLKGDQSIRWRDLAPLPTSEGVTVSITEGMEPAKAESGKSGKVEA